MKPDRGEYRSLSVVLMDGPDFRKLSKDARLTLFIAKLSLGVSGIAAMSGLYGQMSDRTGIDYPQQRDAWQELQEGGWAYYDGMVAWLVRGLELEPNYITSNHNHRLGIQRHVASLPRTALVGSFVGRYAEWFLDSQGAPLPQPKWPAPDDALSAWLIRNPSVSPSNPLQRGSGMPFESGERREEKGERREQHNNIFGASAGARDQLLGDVKSDIQARTYLEDFEHAFRKAGDHDALLRGVEALRSGMHGPNGALVPLVAIGMALRDMNLQGVPLSGRALSRYSATAMKQLAQPVEPSTAPKTGTLNIPVL